MTRRGPAALCLTGALFVLSYALGTPGYDVPGLPFFCLAPFLSLAVSARSARRAAWRGWVAGTAGNIPIYYWISYTIAVQGKLGWGLGSLAAFLVSAYVGAYFSVAAAVAHRLDSRFGDRGLWLFPAAWTALEMGRSYLFSGFPWMLLGYSVAGSATLRQAADLAGVHGLSFLLALSGVSVYLAGKRLSEGVSARAAIRLIPGIAALLFLVLYGRAVSALPPGTAARMPGVKVAVAQGGIDQSVKWDPENQAATLEIYGALTRQAKDAGAQLVVWPETAAPFFYGWEAGLSRKLDAIVAGVGIPVIFGAPWYDPADGGKFYNSVFHMDARGVVLGRYDKRHLVPFGEYIPLSKLFTFAQTITKDAGHFSPGKDVRVLKLGDHPVNALICFEAVFPDLARRFVQKGSQLMVNLTNDGWYGDSAAPYQHLAIARVRAVENRRYLLRATNSGISAIIEPSGRIQASTGLLEEAVGMGHFTFIEGMTLYTRYGDVLVFLCAIILCAVWFFGEFHRAVIRNRQTMED